MSAKTAAYAHIPGMLRSLLHQMVYAQDAGYPLAEELTKERFGSSMIDALATACDNERLRMRNQGIPVYARVGNEGLVLGLKDRPFKQPHQCFQHDAQYGTIDDPANPGQKIDVAACRFCGVPMELQAEPTADELLTWDQQLEAKAAEESSEGSK